MYVHPSITPFEFSICIKQMHLTRFRWNRLMGFNNTWQKSTPEHSRVSHIHLGIHTQVQDQEMFDWLSANIRFLLIHVDWLSAN